MKNKKGAMVVTNPYNTLIISFSPTAHSNTRNMPGDDKQCGGIMVNGALGRSLEYSMYSLGRILKAPFRIL